MVSIIIPVLNEEKKLKNFLTILESIKGEKEIILVDGKSTDNTASIAGSKYTKVLFSERGRSKQMNKGAKYAEGNVLWFLHADSIVDPNSINYIEKAIEDKNIGGGFSLYFYDFNTLFMRYISKTSNIRAEKFGIYFGDQGLFIRKDIFEKLGGYADIDIMEDLELSLRLRKMGKMKLLRYGIGTSARRFKNSGPIRTHILMHKLRILYFLGVSPEKLNKMYREAR
ncbi:TIGR04283 family arsenosugar biosynthesis glycosyltransferase [Clostridium sp. Mt-5]|uniref:4,4'-diaponeurosporenoate glycosyltransferase n=1 Tax=Clostridium moutaii TaxID=3240932 RepID=A0ABV4BMC6_9CLOT